MYLCNLSKALDTLSHDLLIAKLGAYGFETITLRYMKSSLTNKKQRGRVNKMLSEWERITTGVPQGLILGPLLLNIFLNNNLFLSVSFSSFSNYADDNTLCTFGDNLKKIRIIYDHWCINCFTKIIWCRKVSYYMSWKKNKTKHAIISLWEIAKNKQLLVL